jgi:deoxyguanosine kinase
VETDGGHGRARAGISILRVRGPGRQRYVVVEGVIGVGKTTLVGQLARRLGGRTVLEEFEENPFLPGFYRDRRAHALSTQLFFLMSRFRQQEQLAQGDLFQQTTISDYLFDKDRIFALLTLDATELSIYERLFDVLRPQVPTPDLVVFLKADHETVMERIRRRGRSYELDMDPEYIRGLADAYVRFFQSFRLCPVLTIDSTRLDFRSEGAALDGVVEAALGGALPERLSAATGDGREQTLALPGLV